MALRLTCVDTSEDVGVNQICKTIRKFLIAKHITIYLQKQIDETNVLKVKDRKKLINVK